MKILLLCDEGIDGMKELMGRYFLGRFKFIDGPAHSCSAVVDTYSGLTKCIPHYQLRILFV